jgi:Phage Terminase
MVQPLQLVSSSDSVPTLQPAPLPLGSITPRVWTRPLRKLTPRTSYGFAVIHFAATVLLEPLDPWQQWLVIHLGEMMADGRPRFRQVLVIVARQNGKTHLCKVLALFWLFIEKWPMVFGTSTNLEQAKEAWEEAVQLAEDTPELVAMMPRSPKHKRIGNGQQVVTTVERCRYKIGAADSKGGRGKRIDRAIGDELREQHTWDAYLAAYNAMNARPRAQVVYITNMGDSRSIVLNSLRKSALDELGLERPIGIFEWSAPPGTHPTDPAGHAAANPQYGRRMDPDTIIAAARRASKPGADPLELTGFLTEILCMSVEQLDPALDPAGWAACRDPGAIDLEARSRVAACVDVSPDQQHATLAVATLLDAGRVRVELVESWDGPDAMARCLAELPAWIVRVRPRVLGWFPGGPAATLDATLRDRRKKGGRVSWPPRGVTVNELSADAPAVCMGFAALVAAVRVAHSDQPALERQAEQAEKMWKEGGRWVFTRQGIGHVDGLYAAAGAAHLAQTMPARRAVARGVRVAPNG